jgi:hypothetical protein
MGTIRYYPMRIIHNRCHPICSMTFSSPIEALNYALSRGLTNNEIVIKDITYLDDSWDTEIKFDHIEK